MVFIWFNKLFEGIISAIKEHYYRESPRELNVGEQTAVILAYLGPDRLHKFAPKFVLDNNLLITFKPILSKKNDLIQLKS